MAVDISLFSEKTGDQTAINGDGQAVRDNEVLSIAEDMAPIEAGMAKLFASESGKQVVEYAFRIHGGYGYSKEYEVEWLYRDAPLLLIGEGTSEIQRMVIGKNLLARHKA